MRLKQTNEGLSVQIRNLTPRDLDTFGFEIEPENVRDWLTLPSGYPAKAYSYNNCFVMLLGSDEWIETGTGQDCDIILITEDRAYYYSSDIMNAIDVFRQVCGMLDGGGMPETIADYFGFVE